jgi:uncharacterized membrane protein
MNKPKKERRGLNFFKIAGIAGIILIIISILGFIISSLLSFNPRIASAWSIVQSVLFNLLVLLFTFGFYVLGKKYQNKLLKIISILMILFTIISFFFSIFVISPMLSNAFNISLQKASNLGLDLNNLTETQAELFWTELFSDAEFMALLGSVLLLLVLYLLTWLVISILFGIALIKLRKDVKYAKVTGILEIVGACTSIIIIGIPVLIVAFVFEIVIMLNESKKQ